MLETKCAGCKLDVGDGSLIQVTNKGPQDVDVLADLSLWSPGSRVQCRHGRLSFRPWRSCFVHKLLEYKAGVSGRIQGIWKSRTSTSCGGLSPTWVMTMSPTYCHQHYCHQLLISCREFIKEKEAWKSSKWKTSHRVSFWIISYSLLLFWSGLTLMIFLFWTDVGGWHPSVRTLAWKVIKWSESASDKYGESFFHESDLEWPKSVYLNEFVSLIWIRVGQERLHRVE